MTPALVVLTDFLAVSNQALSYAAVLAVPLHAHLVLLHVRHDELLPSAEYAYHSARREWQTERALHELADSQLVPTQVEISEVFLPDAVANAVRRHQPELLVLGRPSSAVQPAEVIVSTVMDLLRHVSYPLLMVPTTGGDTFLPRRLVLAVDGQDFSLCHNREILRELLKKLNATFFILHVTDQENPGAAVGYRAVHTVRHSGVAPVPSGTEAHLIYHPEVAAGILRGTVELEGDLLVVVARRRSLLGTLFHRSVTAQLICESPVPVLVLPATD